MQRRSGRAVRAAGHTGTGGRHDAHSHARADGQPDPDTHPDRCPLA